VVARENTDIMGDSVARDLKIGAEEKEVKT